MYILILLLFSLLYYLPILINPSFMLSRGNDLQEFFIPIFYFVKQSILNTHQLPLWNNLFFSGTPLLPDPQSPLFYLPNIIFLFINKIEIGFLISIFIHIFLSGVTMYLLTTRGFKFNKNISLICSLLYISSPKLSSYLEAGHYGLISSWLFLPLVFLFTINLANNPSIKKAIYLALSLTAVFYLHSLIFIISVITSSSLYFFLSFINKNLFKNIIYILISGLICFGFCAITLLPQLSWQPMTTRNLLLDNPDVYPKWLNYKEFIISVISPILKGAKFIWSLDSEKVISLGIFPSFLTLIGFIKIKFKYKILIAVLGLSIILISLNNISPLHEFLIKQNWYILLRVSTRYWFLIIFISIFLIGNALTYLHKIKKLNFPIYVIIFVSITELLLISWTKMIKPITINIDSAPEEIYQFLASDKSKFRIFCLNRCLSQEKSAFYNLELAGGYGTLQQNNYYEYSQQLSQSFYRNKYTLSIPPFEIYKFENLQPYSPNLAAYNIKYVISDHPLDDKNLIAVKKFDKYFIYLNTINLERSNYLLDYYSPNLIRINTSDFKDNFVILSEVYSPDWYAYLNGKLKREIEETPDKLRSVKIDKDIKFVEFEYEPRNFRLGIAITILTILFSAFILKPVRFYHKKNYTKK